MSWVYALERSLGAARAVIAGTLVLFVVAVAIQALRRHGAVRSAQLIASAGLALALAGVAMATLEPMTAVGHDLPRRLILDPVLGATDGYGHTVWRPLLANVALFVPVGAVAAARFPGRGLRVWILLVALSVVIEATQYTLPIGRIANTADLVANATGAALGIGLNRLAVALVGPRRPERRPAGEPVLTARRRP